MFIFRYELHLVIFDYIPEPFTNVLPYISSQYNLN